MEKVQRGTTAASDRYFITVEKGGPYLVYGMPPINQEIITPDGKGQSWTWLKGLSIENDEEPIALCRCGQSHHKPCCDGSHAHADWDPVETADTEPLMPNARKFEGKSVHLTLNDIGRKFCTFARFCDIDGDAWHSIRDASSQEDKELLIHEATHCPSGRLVLENQETGEIYEPDFDPSIGLVEDGIMKVSGPIWVKGGIRIESAAGENYEVRNRVTLCRCGASKNKPFCDGTHLEIKFQDGMK